MKVPSNWWNGIRTRELHDGKIKSFDELQQKWMLELDSEPDNEYGMAYEAVHAYVDEGSSTYEDYRLPADPTREEDEIAVRAGDDNNQTRRYTSTQDNVAEEDIKRFRELAREAAGETTKGSSSKKRKAKGVEDAGDPPWRREGHDLIGRKGNLTTLKNNRWRSHQSVATVCKNDGGNCQYDWCPGLVRQNKRKRSYPTRYRCSQCSISKGHPVYLCNTTKKKDDGTYWAVLCHMKYHEQQFGIDSQIDTEEAPADPSDGDESDSS